MPGFLSAPQESITIGTLLPLKHPLHSDIWLSLPRAGPHSGLLQGPTLQSPGRNGSVPMLVSSFRRQQALQHVQGETRLDLCTGWRPCLQAVFQERQVPARGQGGGGEPGSGADSS